VSVASNRSSREEHLGLFLQHTQESLRNGSFVSLTLHGPSKKVLQQQVTDETRGAIRLVAGRLVQVKHATKLQVTIKYHLATDIVKNWDLDVAGEWMEALFTAWAMPRNGEHDRTRSERNRFVAEAASEWGDEVLYAAPGTPLAIQRGTLETVTTIWDLQVQHKLKKPRLVSKPTPERNGIDGPSQTSFVPLAHDRVKQGPVPTKAAFLQALGVTNEHGKPRAGMASKLRQCQKFVEIVHQHIRQALPTTDTQSSIDVVDMGCGRGYLTFALHHFLRQQYQTANVQSRGIDVRPKLVDEINGIAQALGKDMEGLVFEQGTIESHLAKARAQRLAKPDTNDSLRVSIALHACDTATDDALWSGIMGDSHVIVVAPCCHRQVRPQLNQHANQNPSHALGDVLRHNIYRERMAETVTDSIRALLMELAGYQVQVFEFIGGEHTSKNVMLTGVKRFDRYPTNGDAEDLRRRLRELASLHGIHKHTLASFMGESLLLDDASQASLPLSKNRMPPL
jgi:SAM-dependent methyltransferase